MQSEVVNYRYRGWRESRPLVRMTKAAAADMQRIRAADDANQQAFAALQAQTTTLTETDVSELQHLRAQLAFHTREI